MYKFFHEMTDEELKEVDLIDYTGLKVGDRISHVNAGYFLGNGSIISSQLGTVMGHQNRGLRPWGGLCVVITVLWDDGEEHYMDSSFAKKVWPE